MNTSRTYLQKIDYPFLPCVYVRQIKYTNQFYIGMTMNLLTRGYKMHELEELIYFETFPEGTQRGTLLNREEELMQEFKTCDLLLANKRQT
jgi:hypothetical protein